MNNLIVNIGLNVGNNEPINQLFKTKEVINDFFNQDFIKNASIETSEWEGVKERTFVFKAKVGILNKRAIAEILSIMAYELNQDAIAFKLNGEGCIAFSGSYVKEIYSFNENFFIEL